MGRRSRIILTLAVTGTLAAAAVLTAAALDGWPRSRSGGPTRDAAPAATQHPARPPVVGAYEGPGARGIAGLVAWERWSGSRSPYGLDFEAADSWWSIQGPDWLLDPWGRAGRTLVLSVPLLPTGPGPTRTTLAACATGAYDPHWVALGVSLVRHRLSTTIVRPGWEFNGDWYPWRAADDPDAYAACFRHLVSTMRSVPGQHFQFLWNPTVGVQEFPAELAFPGTSYVDIVGVDVYDVSWDPAAYPVPAGAGPPEQVARQAVAWATVEDGDGGLRFWSTFARQRGLALAIPEWGLTRRADGHGGADNPDFVDHLVDVLTDPTYGVRFSFYFDVTNIAGDQHTVSRPDTPFPVAADQLRRRLHPPD